MEFQLNSLEICKDRINLNMFAGMEIFLCKHFGDREKILCVNLVEYSPRGQIF